MALPASHRLRRRRDILQVLSMSQQRRGSFFMARFHWKANPPGRLSVVVSKRVSKLATERNTIKRLVTEWARTAGALRHLAADVMISALPEARHAARPVLRRDLAGIFSFPRRQS